jgi:murein DD-endopeptidase MepM/ murein hydrolase activator NlpD
LSQASLSVTAGSAGLALPLVGVHAASAAPADSGEKLAVSAYLDDATIGTGGLHSGAPGAGGGNGDRAGDTADAPHAGPSAGDRRTTRSRTALGRPATDSTKGPDRPGPEAYTVASGDTLFTIARVHGVEGGWVRLYEDNRGVVGGDPDLILPGQRLSLRGGAIPDTGHRLGRERRADPEREAEPDHHVSSSDRTAGPHRQASPSEEGAGSQARTPGRRTTAGHNAERTSGTRPQRSDPAPESPLFTVPVAGASPGTPYRASGGGWASGYHTGVDFPVATGTSVRAVGGGHVLSAGWAGAYGYQVVIRHPDGKYSQYAHLSALSVRAGQQVNSGQRIGRSGSTGNSTGPHLHFEIRTAPGYGSDIDPLSYLRGKGVGI